jgi:hypothetical protein
LGQKSVSLGTRIVDLIALARKQVSVTNEASRHGISIVLVSQRYPSDAKSVPFAFQLLGDCLKYPRNPLRWNGHVSAMAFQSLQELGRDRKGEFHPVLIHFGRSR